MHGNAAAHRLRKLLGHDDALTLGLGRLGLDTRVMWVDSLVFEALADQMTLPLTQASAQAARRALALYRGHFLHDDEEHVWLLAHCSRLASKFRRLVWALAEHGAAADDATGVRDLLERAIELDPLAEDLARLLMQHLAARGESEAALLVFERRAAAMAGLRRSAALPPKFSNDR